MGKGSPEHYVAAMMRVPIFEMIHIIGVGRSFFWPLAMGRAGLDSQGTVLVSLSDPYSRAYYHVSILSFYM